MPFLKCHLSFNCLLNCLCCSRVLGRADLVLAWGEEPGWWVERGGLGAWESYLQSGKQRTVVRQAKDSQASTVVRQSKDSQASTQPFHRLAPNIRILCTQPFPHTCTQMFYRHAPKIRIHALKCFRIHDPNVSAYMHVIPHTY